MFYLVYTDIYLYTKLKPELPCNIKNINSNTNNHRIIGFKKVC